MDDKLYMFDGIVCICTTQEEDRWQKNCVPQFKYFGCLDRVIRFYGDLPKDKTHLNGCSLAHYNVLKMCKEKGFKMPLILESDFYFRLGDVTKKHIHGIYDEALLLNSIKMLTNVDWKLFFLGGHIKKCDKNTWPNILKVRCELTHAYSVNYKYYDDIIGTLEKSLHITPDLIYSRKKYGKLYDYCYMTPCIMVIQKWWKKEKWRTHLMWRTFRNSLGYEHLI